MDTLLILTSDRDTHGQNVDMSEETQNIDQEADQDAVILNPTLVASCDGSVLSSGSPSPNDGKLHSKDGNYFKSAEW